MSAQTEVGVIGAGAWGTAIAQMLASDGRSVSLTLTEAGQARWQEVMALIDRRNQEIFGCLSPGEQLLLGEMFDRLIAHAKVQQQQRCDD